MIRIAILQAGTRDAFPPVDSALAEPNGLLAAGGDLSPQRLLDAYSKGIFPWYTPDTPILWWSPHPRMAFATDRVHVSTKLRRWLKSCDWTIAADRSFATVIGTCAEPRDAQGTWITDAVLEAYCKLHELGHAHSVEVRDAAGRLVGGIYGVAIGHMFFGESMFSRATNGSKVALIALCRALHGWGFPLLDAQVVSPHLVSMGAVEVPRSEFIARMRELVARDSPAGDWNERWPSTAAQHRACSRKTRAPRPNFHCLAGRNQSPNRAERGRIARRYFCVRP